MSRQNGFSALGPLVVIVFFAGTAGWVMNIVSIISAIDGPINAMLLIRVAGVFFAPLGAVIGYF